LWARWEDAAAGQRPASAVGALLCLDLLVLLHPKPAPTISGAKARRKRRAQKK